MNMKNSSERFLVILVKYPFTDSKIFKTRPAIIINDKQEDSEDYFIVPLTSRISGLKEGEFVLNDYKKAGLHIPSAVKRGIYTIHSTLIIKRLKHLSKTDQKRLTKSLVYWLNLYKK